VQRLARSRLGRLDATSAQAEQTGETGRLPPSAARWTISAISGV
jgi:hypothetical protein